jgi:hypothetical protein
MNRPPPPQKNCQLAIFLPTNETKKQEFWRSYTNSYDLVPLMTAYSSFMALSQSHLQYYSTSYENDKLYAFHESIVLRLCNKSVYKQHSKEDIVEEA